ncbi:MAG: hypothetical protein RLW68_01880 [Devosia marina]|uniref:hypothetical protein n=1 Tax=Devosia marina TaxID=2683198 RepID=UPI0032EAA1B5
MGAKMGWSSQEVKAASMWEFFAAWNGYIEAPQDKAKLTESEADELFAWIEADNDGPQTLSTQTYWLDGDRLVPAGIVTFEVQ